MPLPEKALLEQFEIHFHDAKQSSDWWRQCEVVEGREFKDGWQWDFEAKKTLEEENRPTVVFNEINKQVRAVVGLMLQNRQEVKFYPRQAQEEGQAGTSDLIEDAYRWMRQQGHAEKAERGAFEDLIISGLGCVELVIDYSENPDGETRYRRVDPLEVFWDAQAIEQNLTDARWVARKRILAREEVEEMFPSTDIDEFQEYTGPTEGQRIVDDNRDYPRDNRTNRRFQGKEEMYEVVQYEYYTQEKYFRVRNPLTQEGVILQPGGAFEAYMTQAMQRYDFEPNERFFNMKLTDKNNFEDELEAFQIDLDYSEATKRVYHKAFISGKNVIRNMESDRQNGFTLRFMTADWDSKENSFYGLVRLMKDPARYKNKSFSQLLHAINANPYGGLLAEKGAVSDANELESAYAFDDTILYFEDGSLRDGRVIPKPVNNSLPNYEHIRQVSEQAMFTATGLTPDFFGQMGTAQQNAAAQDQRIEQTVVVLAPYMDAMREYQRKDAHDCVAALQVLMENNENRLIRVYGEFGVQYEEMARDKFVMDYDIELEQAPVRPSVKAETFKSLLNFAGSFPDNAQMLMPLILQFAPLDKKVRAEIEQRMEQAARAGAPTPEEQQLALQQQMLQLQAQQAQNQYLQASSEEKQASAIEKSAQAGAVQSEVAYDQARAYNELVEAMKTAIEAGINVREAEQRVFNDQVSEVRDGQNGANPQQ